MYKEYTIINNYVILNKYNILYIGSFTNILKYLKKSFTKINNEFYIVKGHYIISLK